MLKVAAHKFNVQNMSKSNSNYRVNVNRSNKSVFQQKYDR